MKTSSNSSTTLDDAAAGCLASVLRRILCSTINNSRVTEEDAINGVGEVYKKPEAPPCIVARLMGLDSMPVNPHPPPDSIRRSRSTNSLDNLPAFITTQRYRCSSFREAPTFLTEEKEDLLLLSFTNGDGPKNPRSSIPPTDLEDKKSKFNGEVKMMMMKNRNGVVNSPATFPSRNFDRKITAGVETGKVLKPANQRLRHESSSEKSKNLVQNRKKVDLDCNSENMSPDSVLDCSCDLDAKYSTSTNSLLSSEVKKQREKKKSRRNLSPDLEVLSCSSPSSKFTHEEVIRSGKPDEFEPKELRDRQKNQRSDASRYVFGITHQEMKKTDRIVKGNWSVAAADIAGDVEMEILDLLLQEEVAEYSF